MALRNHNSWNEEMVDRAENLIRNMKVPITTNRYGEKLISMTNKTTQVMKTIAIILNKEFGTTLTGNAVANKFHYEHMTPEQKETARKRYEQNKLRKLEANRLTLSQQTSITTDSSTEEPDEKKPVIGVSEVIIRCARLVGEGKMTNQELLTVIDSL